MMDFKRPKMGAYMCGVCVWGGDWGGRPSWIGEANLSKDEEEHDLVQYVI